MPMPMRNGSETSWTRARLSASLRSGIWPAAAGPPAAARLDAAVEAEARHHAIADEFVDAPARGLDRVAGLGKVAIEQEDQIVGQFLFRELREGPQIPEQDRNLAFGAVQVAGTAESV